MGACVDSAASQVYMPAQLVHALQHLQPDEILMSDCLEAALNALEVASTDVLGKLGLLDNDLYEDECNAFRWEILFTKVQEAREKIKESSTQMPSRWVLNSMPSKNSTRRQCSRVAESVNALALAAMRIVVMTLHFRPENEVWPVWNDEDTSVLAARWPYGLEPSSVQRRLADLLGQLAAAPKIQPF